jgi:nicotinamide-nucleotide amidase
VKAEVLTIGDELLRGEIVDSNKSFLSERLLRLDIETCFQSSVRDVPSDMSDALRRAVERSDVVLVSGGLGPTRDDLTIEVLAKTFDRKLLLHAPSLEALREFYARVGREMPEINTKQAWMPEGAEALPNPIGTAPGCMLLVGEVPIFCMPGVPRELHRMLDEQVLPRIDARHPGRAVVRARILRTFGMGESNLEEALSGVARGGEVVLGFRTAFPDNLLRPLTRAATAAEADARLEQVCAAIRERLGPLIYAEGDETLESVVGRLLRERGRTLAVAESCTGGMLAERITSVAGASDYFLGGVVAYANAAKQALLGVPGTLLEQHGAVSEPVARAMAEGVRARFGADLAIATTGISGPGGGSEEKPVGSVCIALASASGTHVERFVFPVERARHRSLSTQIALDWVRRTLLGVPLVAPTLMRRTK